MFYWLFQENNLKNLPHYERESERVIEYLWYLTKSVVKILCQKEKGLSVPWFPFLFSPLLSSITFRWLQLLSEILNEAKSLHLWSKGSPCFSHSSHCPGTRKLPLLPYSFFKLVDLF